MQSPDVDASMPSGDVSAPGYNVSAPDMSLKTPEVDASLPTVDLKVPEVDGSLPTADMDVPSADVSAPDVRVSGPEGGLDVGSLKAGVAAGAAGVAGALGAAGGYAAGKFKGDKPEVDANVDAPSAEFAMPSAEVDVPSVDVDAPSASLGVDKPKSKFSMKGLFGRKKGDVGASASLPGVTNLGSVVSTIACFLAFHGAVSMCVNVVHRYVQVSGISFIALYSVTVSSYGIFRREGTQHSVPTRLVLTSVMCRIEKC